MIKPRIIKRAYQSGFKAEIILKPHFKQKFFGLMIDFGSSDPQKIAGSAHFLEHKLFAKKDGDISQKFEAIGADVNAFTSFNETMFYCNGVEHVPKMITLLFKLVGQPYFTAANVASEAPIIEQELAMYQDDPSWAVNNAIMRGMFGQSNLGLEVVGTTSSIKKVTVTNLLATYRKHYLANKIQFIASGSFSTNQIKTILRQVGKLQKQYFSSRRVQLSPVEIPQGQNKVWALPVAGDSQAFGLGIRFKNFKKVLSSLDLTQILLEIMLESKLSVMGPWFEKMRQKQLLTDALQISVNYTRQGDFATIFGTSPRAEKTISKIKTIITAPLPRNPAVFRFVRQNFALQKKEWLARAIRTINDLPDFATEMVEENLDQEDLWQNLANLQALNFTDFYQSCQQVMKDSTICAAYLNSKTGSD